MSEQICACAKDTEGMGPSLSKQKPILVIDNAVMIHVRHLEL